MFRPSVQNLRLLQLYVDNQDLEDRRLAGLLVHLRHQQQLAAERRQRRPRSCWVKPWKTQERKEDQSPYFQLMRELEHHDVPAFIRYLRFQPEMFHEMEHRLHNPCSRVFTFMRRPLEVGERIAITLRYLATGETFRSLAFSFRLGNATVSRLIPQVCEAIITEFGPEVMPSDRSEADWVETANEFERLWNFPHVLGAIDGKHVAITKPAHGGSVYYNYKKFHSIIFLAIVDAHYKFLEVDIGRNGAASDAQVFNHSDMRQAIEDETAGLPGRAPIHPDDGAIPYYFIGDDAFALKTWLMKPYSRRGLKYEEKIFNYRLSRARRVVENAFGILVKRFRCLLKTLEVGPDKAATIVLACVILHNLMRIRYPRMQQRAGDRLDNRGRIMRGTWRNDDQLVGGQNLPGGNYGAREAKELRNYLRDHFNSPRGSVPWQYRMV